MRRWHEWAAYDWQVMVTPQLVQVLTSGAMNFVTNIHVGREFKMVDPVPRLGENVPRWYGETIGFWDEDTLITWTSNIQAWASHTAFEHSNRMQSIEIYTPMRDADGKFVGLNHESILYDPEALVEPIRIIRRLVKLAEFNDPKANPIVFTTNASHSLQNGQSVRFAFMPGGFAALDGNTYPVTRLSATTSN